MTSSADARAARWIAGVRRAIGALAGSLVGALLGGALSGWVRAPMDRRGGAIREAALFVPFAVAVAITLVPAALFLSRARIAAFTARLASRDGALARTTATLLIAPAAVVIWIGVLARAGQYFLTAFHHVGLASLAQSSTFVFVSLVGWLAYGTLHRAIARRISETPRVGLALARAAALGVALAALCVFVGVRTGNTNGRGALLGAFGVLRKPELNLAPVYALAAVFAIAALVTLVAARWLWLGAALVVVGAAATYALHVYVAHHFAESPSAVVIEARPNLARITLRALRHRTDRDHDGVSGLYGGGDCNDHDARIQPNAHDTPGNGIDEDCSGTDAPLPPPPAPPTPPTQTEHLAHETPDDMNLVLVTIDTLRADLHYAGNPRDLSPNLDRLATQAVVFDHAYALSSYTGKAIAPMMAGRYPTECAADGEHFTTYYDANVLLAERLRDAGFRTMGVASHFYFEPQYGLAQGITHWDMSAEPSSDDQETATRDAQVADRALTMLHAQDTQTGRFFLWVHFFDPHKMYVPHPELTSFGNGDRAHYDLEVEWSDRQFGRLVDALDASPFARRTMLMVTADHGEAFGEHDTIYHGVELWEELVRIPWMFRVPGIAPRHVSTWRSQIDMVPTLLELLRVPMPAATAPDALSGVSLVPDLLGEPAPARPIYIELPEGPFNAMRRVVIDGGWKLNERGAQNFELYDLVNDPGERTNLVWTRHDDLMRMRGVMERVRAGLHAVPAR